MSHDSENLTREEILRLIRKYAIIMLVFELVIRYGFPLVIAPLFSGVDMRMVPMVLQLLFGVVVGLIAFQDLDSTRYLSWIILACALVSPWFCVMFLLIWKVAELKSTSTDR